MGTFLAVAILMLAGWWMWRRKRFEEE